MLSGCDATTPTAPELRRLVLNYLLGTAFSAEAVSRPARSACFLPLCCRRTPLVGARCGKRVRPGKSLKHLQGTVFSAEALSRPARPAFFLPFCCRRTPLVGARCGQTSAGPPVRPLFFLSAAGALLWLVLAVDKRVRPGKAREAKLLWLAAPSGPIALLHIGLKRDVRHPAAAEQAVGAPLVRARCGEASAASQRAGREAVLAGCALGTDSLLFYFLLSI